MNPIVIRGVEAVGGAVGDRLKNGKTNSAEERAILNQANPKDAREYAEVLTSYKEAEDNRRFKKARRMAGSLVLVAASLAGGGVYIAETLLHEAAKPVEKASEAVNNAIDFLTPEQEAEVVNQSFLSKVEFPDKVPIVEANGNDVATLQLSTHWGIFGRIPFTSNTTTATVFTKAEAGVKNKGVKLETIVEEGKPHIQASISTKDLYYDAFQTNPDISSGTDSVNKIDKGFLADSILGSSPDNPLDTFVLTQDIALSHFANSCKPNVVREVPNNIQKVVSAELKHTKTIVESLSDAEVKNNPISPEVVKFINYALSQEVDVVFIDGDGNRVSPEELIISSPSEITKKVLVEKLGLDEEDVRLNVGVSGCTVSDENNDRLKK